MSKGRKKTAGNPAKTSEAEAPIASDEPDEDYAGIYHRMYAHEDFETTAEILLKLVHQQAQEHPTWGRVLFLDIDGHRNEKGGFDQDAWELQHHFILGYLSQFLCGINTPLLNTKRWSIAKQSNDVPAKMNFVSGIPSAKRNEMLKEQAETFGPTWDAEKMTWIKPDDKGI